MTSGPSSTQTTINFRAISFLIHSLIAALLSVCFLWPVLLNPNHVVPSTFPDVFMFIWNVWLSQHQEGWLPSYITDVIMLPGGASLLLHTWCEGLVWIPARVFPALNPILLFNGIVFTALSLNYVAAAFLVSRFGCRPLPSLVVSAVIAFNPFVVGHLVGGHLNFVFIAPPLVVAGLWFKPFRSVNSFAGILWAGFAITWTAFYNLYFFYFLGLLAGTGIIAALVINRESIKIVSIRFGVPMLIAFIVSGYHLWSIVEITRFATYTPNHDPLKHSADLFSFFTPGPFQIFGNAEIFENARQSFGINAAEQGQYFGWSFLVLAFIGLLRTSALERRQVISLILIAIFFAALSFGPLLHVYGAGGPRLPWFEFLENILPSFPSVPARFGFLATVFIMMSALTGLSRLGKAGQIVAASICLMEFLPITLPTMVLEPTPVLSYLGSVSPVTVLDTDGLDEVTMIRQVFHGQRMAGGYLARRPKSYERLLRRNGFMRFVRDGISVESQQLRRNFDVFAVQMVLVSKSSPDRVIRLRAVPWLKQEAEDDNLVLFRVTPIGP